MFPYLLPLPYNYSPLPLSPGRQSLCSLTVNSINFYVFCSALGEFSHCPGPWALATGLH